MQPRRDYADRVAAEFGGAVVSVYRRHSRLCACLVARKRKRRHGEARPRGDEVSPSRQCPVSGGKAVAEEIGRARPRRGDLNNPRAPCLSERTSGAAVRGVRVGPILLQKSPQRLCEIRIGNNRIDAVKFLNQCCARAPDLESILRAQMGKIFLQQYRPEAVVS
jgi:hypothetical protein